VLELLERRRRRRGLAVAMTVRDSLLYDRVCLRDRDRQRERRQQRKRRRWCTQCLCHKESSERAKKLLLGPGVHDRGHNDGGGWQSQQQLVMAIVMAIAY
jgi:hypothetical protein